MVLAVLILASNSAKAISSSCNAGEFWIANECKLCRQSGLLVWQGSCWVRPGGLKDKENIKAITTLGLPNDLLDSAIVGTPDEGFLLGEVINLELQFCQVNLAFLFIALPDSELPLVVLFLGLLDRFYPVSFEGVLVSAVIEVCLGDELLLLEQFKFCLFMAEDIGVIGEGSDDFLLGFDLLIELGDGDFLFQEGWSKEWWWFRVGEGFDALPGVDLFLQLEHSDSFSGGASGIGKDVPFLDLLVWFDE